MNYNQLYEHLGRSTTNDLMEEETWLFGYGSLIWRPDFPFLDSGRAYIDGWTRRFWQGSHDHRGHEADPGRVVTLISASNERCYGRAFRVAPEVFEHLDHREKNGYERHAVDIHLEHQRHRGVVYIAATDNVAFLGEASSADIAAHIYRCAGPSGTNLEYLLELANALRLMKIADPHVFELETLALSMGR